jgi:hypothetical protein
MGRLPAPKNNIADPKSGVVTPEWLSWLQEVADEATASTGLPSPPLTPPPSESGGGGGGGGGLTIINNYGSGTPPKIPKWLAPQTLGDSIISEEGSTVMITGDLTARSFTGQLPLHAVTHEAGGTDAIPLDALAPARDVTLLNASTTTHGLLPKLSGVATQYLNGIGVWMPVSGGGGGSVEEVFVGPSDPGLSFELWFDTDQIPVGGGPPGVLKVLVAGVWQTVTVVGPAGPAGPAGPTGPPGTAGLHAPTHSAGSTDPVDVKNLAGYPGGTTAFLRGDHTFAVPPGGGGMNLDYLGPYTPGTYNDGDIVIGSDNIAYMCVVDGTTTPPEPWPGVGMATAVGPPGPPGPTGPAGPPNAAVDATYWTVTPHATLTNERALSALANGYVKSTAGEPSTVATIPISDTTGTVPDARLSSNVALKNLDNHFVTQTFAAGSVFEGAISHVYHRSTSGAVDARVWRTVDYGDGVFRLEALNDAITVVQATYLFNRNGDLQATRFVGDGSQLTGIIPVGTIVMRSDACPPGWSRVAWDGMFLRVGAAFSTAGGGNPITHTHGGGTLADSGHTHPAGSYAAASHSHGGSVSGTTGSVGDHSHGWGFNGNTGGESAGIMNVDGGSSGNMTRGPHTHTINIGGTTDGGGGHSHSFSGGIPAEAPGITGNSGSGGGAIGGATAAASHLPPYFDVILCIKN